MSRLIVPRNGVVYNVKSLNMWANDIHDWGIEKGWCTEDLPDDPGAVKLIIIEKLLMMHTELSEATEALRDVDFTDVDHFMDTIRCSYTTLENVKPEGFASELVDELIRVLHLCAILGIDVEGEMELKMKYNWTRAYKHGGKNL